MTVRMAKSRPRKNQSERSDLPCHIIKRVIFFERARASAEGDSGREAGAERIYLSFPTATPLRSRTFKSPAVSILFVISTNSRQNRGSVNRVAVYKPSDLLGRQSSMN